MNIDVKKIGKAVLPALGLVCTIAAQVISNKQQDETISKKVTEALANQAKES